MKATIWPANIDLKKTEKEGRKIPRKYAVNSPKLREISRAASKLGLNPEVENDKSYSKSWWENSGRVVVDKKQPKRDILIKISNMIKGFRKT
ncbi:MAG: signal recognition particle protein Srp19 [Methanobacterium sp.]|jgi:signal recognition particle subunit SRP19|nr:signal recognition particle protein Srp19 [Methanobacterium sp.]